MYIVHSFKTAQERILMKKTSRCITRNAASILFILLLTKKSFDVIIRNWNHSFKSHAAHAMQWHFFTWPLYVMVTVSKDESGHYLMIVGIPCPSGWSTKWLDVHIAALFTLQSGSWHNSHCTRLDFHWHALCAADTPILGMKIRGIEKTRHWKDYALQVLMLCVALMYFLSKALHCTPHLTRNTRLWGFVYRVSTLSTHFRLWTPMRRGNFWWCLLNVRQKCAIDLGSTISDSRHNHLPPQALCNTSLHTLLSPVSEHLKCLRRHLDWQLFQIFNL